MTKPSSNEPVVVQINPVIKALYEKWKGQMGLGHEQTAATLVLAEVNLMNQNSLEDLRAQNEHLKWELRKYTIEYDENHGVF